MSATDPTLEFGVSITGSFYTARKYFTGDQRLPAGPQTVTIADADITPWSHVTASISEVKENEPEPGVDIPWAGRAIFEILAVVPQGSELVVTMRHNHSAPLPFQITYVVMNNPQLVRF